jgi:hypothetical protein
MAEPGEAVIGLRGAAPLALRAERRHDRGSRSEVGSWRDR